MAYKVFTTEVLTSSDVNNHLMKQAVIGCTSGTRPSSPQDGMTLWETDTKTITVRDTSWQNMLQMYSTSYSPAWTGDPSNPSLGNGSLVGRYLRISAKMYYVSIQLLIGSTTTGGSGRWLFSLPAAPVASRAQVLSAIMEDTSASHRWAGSAFLTNASHIFGVMSGSGGSIGAGPTVPFTWANGDGLLITGIYEAA